MPAVFVRMVVIDFGIDRILDLDADDIPIDFVVADDNIATLARIKPGITNVCGLDPLDRDIG